MVTLVPRHARPDEPSPLPPGSGTAGYYSARATSSTSKHSITSPVWMS
jgi:hypothetical protein